MFSFVCGRGGNGVRKGRAPALLGKLLAQRAQCQPAESLLSRTCPAAAAALAGAVCEEQQFLGRWVRGEASACISGPASCPNPAPTWKWKRHKIPSSLLPPHPPAALRLHHLVSPPVQSLICWDWISLLLSPSLPHTHTQPSSLGQPSTRPPPV